MTIEFNPDVSQFAAVPRPLRLATVHVVQEEQVLPDIGKDLPQNNQKEVMEEKLTEAVTNLNDYVQIIRRELKFTIAENSGRTIITVLDAETKEVIREIPPDEVLVLAHGLTELADNEGHILNTRS